MTDREFPTCDLARPKETARWWEPLVAVGFTVACFFGGFVFLPWLGITIGWAGFLVALTGIIALPQFVFGYWRDSSVVLSERHRDLWSKVTFGALALFVLCSGAVARLGLIAS